MSLQPTSLRFADPGIRALFEEKARWQAWLDVEAALALAQAEIGMIPSQAADVIAASARVELLDRGRIDEGFRKTGHTLVPLVWELARICGEAHGGYVHWGATTQNILETGDTLLLSRAHGIILGQVSALLLALGDTAEREADIVMAGRTHGQHAVPITFGYKVAVWIDEILRHVDRLEQLEPRVFVAVLGGAAGTLASLGPQGVDIQAGVARRLGLGEAGVPSRTHADRGAEYVTALGLLAGTAAKIGHEFYTLMRQEFAEAREPVPAGTVGSSTMAQKRNPILAQDIIAGAAQVRALVPLALEAMITEHEADRTTSVMLRASLGPACVHIGDILGRLNVIAADMEIDRERMRSNLDLTGGMILSEAIMMQLGETLGRQDAHDLLYDAAEAVLAGERTFADALQGDPRIADKLDPKLMRDMLDPSRYTGLSGQMARQQAVLARERAGAIGAGAVGVRRNRS